VKNYEVFIQKCHLVLTCGGYDLNTKFLKACFQGKPWDVKNMAKLSEYHVPMFKGYNETIEILKYDVEKVYETQNWGPMLLAIYSGNMQAVTHLL